MSVSDLPPCNAAKPPQAAPASAPVTNPQLSAAVVANLDALKNDVEQAKELAAEYQRQLAGKSNELADFKHLFEKTQTDLIHLQASIGNLRLERHRLANEAMKAEALELRLKQAAARSEEMNLKLKQAATERECLQNEVEALRRVRGTECDPRVKKLTAENEELRGELIATRRQLENLTKNEASSVEEEEEPLLRFAAWPRRRA